MTLDDRRFAHDQPLDPVGDHSRLVALRHLLRAVSHSPLPNERRRVEVEPGRFGDATEVDYPVEGPKDLWEVSWIVPTGIDVPEEASLGLHFHRREPKHCRSKVSFPQGVTPKSRRKMTSARGAPINSVQGRTRLLRNPHPSPFGSGSGRNSGGASPAPLLSCTENQFSKNQRPGAIVMAAGITRSSEGQF